MEGFSAQSEQSAHIAAPRLPRLNCLCFCAAQKVKLCVPSLGVADDTRVGDDMMTGTHTKNNRDPHFARLNHPDKSWCCNADDPGELTVTFDSPTLVVAVFTQGHPKKQEWVAHYEVRAGHASLGNFQGNTRNGDETIENWFSNHQRDTAITIIPQQSDINRCLRIEMYGVNDGM